MDESIVPGRLLLSKYEAAKALGISPRTLQDLTKRGEMIAVRIGRRVMYDPADLRTFIQQRKAA